MQSAGALVRWLRAGLLLLAVPAAARPADAQRAATLAAAGTAPAWRVTTLDHVDLWYHGLALIGFGVAEPAALYDPAYAPRVRAAKQRRGLAPTPLDRAAAAMASTFERDRAFEINHLLPLYFANADWPAILHAVRTLDRGGSRRDLGSERIARVLAAALPRSEQRGTLRRFAEMLEAERGLWLAAETNAAAGSRLARARAVERRWNTVFAPSLAPFLTHIGRAQGTIVLSPPLGREGRNVGPLSGASSASIVAIAMPLDDGDEETTAAAFDILRELCFATARTVLGDRVPSGDPVAAETLSRAIAVHCGAKMLRRYLPQYRAAYEARFIPPSAAAAVDTASDGLARTFPLPPAIEERLVAELASY